MQGTNSQNKRKLAYTIPFIAALLLMYSPLCNRAPRYQARQQPIERVERRLYHEVPEELALGELRPLASYKEGSASSKDVLPLVERLCLPESIFDCMEYDDTIQFTTKHGTAIIGNSQRTVDIAEISEGSAYLDMFDINGDDSPDIGMYGNTIFDANGNTVELTFGVILPGDLGYEVLGELYTMALDNSLE